MDNVNFDKQSYLPTEHSTHRGSYLSYIDESDFAEESYCYNRTPIQMILSKFCDHSISDYIFHTRIALEYDDEEAFVFVFKGALVFTHLFDEKEHDLKTNPTIYIIKFQQIYFYNLQVNESEGNHILLQF
jgi:hypothetical protein